MVALALKDGTLEEHGRNEPAKQGSQDEYHTPFSLQTIGRFPTTRRPQARQLSGESEGTIESWFNESGISIGSKVETAEQRSRARRLLYTWKDCFAATVQEIQPTDLIEHSIDLTPDVKPCRGKLP